MAAFRGSFLELMLALEPHCNDVRPDHVLVHMPGFNTSNIVDTPSLELYRAGKSFQNLSTLVAEGAHGHALPNRLPPSSRILARRFRPRIIDQRLLRTGVSQASDALAIYLQGRGTNGIVADLVGRDERLQMLLGNAAVDPETALRFREHLRRALGVMPAWEELRLPSVSPRCSSQDQRLCASNNGSVKGRRPQPPVISDMRRTINPTAQQYDPRSGESGLTIAYGHQTGTRIGTPGQ